MITEEQKKKYEQAAKEYSSLLPHQNSLMTEAAELDFVAGTSYAHSEGKKEGWNEAIEKAIKISENRQDESTDNAEYLGHLKVIEELKKLKR